jgi:DNA polymerase II small subunit
MMHEEKKKEIVDKFFQYEHLLTPEALDFLLNSDWQSILENVKNIDKLFLDKEDIEKFEYKDKVRIIKNLLSKPENLTTETFTKFYNSMFEKMRSIILSRINKEFISIENIKQRKIGYVIGRVREIVSEDDKKIIELEDITGTKSFIFDKKFVPNDLLIGDIIAAEVSSSVYKDDILTGKEILYPDIPLRQPKKSHGKILIISDLHLDEAPKEALKSFYNFFENSDIKFLIIAGDIGDIDALKGIVGKTRKTIFLIPGEKDSPSYPSLPLNIDLEPIVSLSNPSLIEINDVKILIIHNFDIRMLKKRYLGPSKLILEEDYLSLDEVPDIIACGHTHEPEIFNYKSVTIANAGSLLTEFRPILIDLSTREYKQLRFD